MNFNTHINNNGSSISNQKEIANIFGKYFKSVGPSLASLIPNPSKNFVDYLGNPNHSSFYLFPTHGIEIYETMIQFNSILFLFFIKRFIKYSA